MKTKQVQFIMVLFLLFSACTKKEMPEAEISNGLISAHILLPDKENGYYRGTRFDWSGVISELTYDGHSYFGQWFEEYSPTLHDAIMGPVEEFGQLGYEDASAGQSFVKIGVGRLTKTSDSSYNRFSYYPIEDNGKWKVRKNSDGISFYQELDGTDYSYAYTKTITLAEGKPEMAITHVLRNTGNKIIATNVYDHNFFVMDGQYTGPDFWVTFPFSVMVDSSRLGGIAMTEGNRIGFNRELMAGETAGLGTVTGYSDNISDFDIRVENSKTGAGVRVKGDRPLSRILFWSSLKTLCPETYINISVEPGQEFTWTFTYEFYSRASE